MHLKLLPMTMTYDKARSSPVNFNVPTYLLQMIIIR